MIDDIIWKDWMAPKFMEGPMIWYCINCWHMIEKFKHENEKECPHCGFVNNFELYTKMLKYESEKEELKK